MDFDRNDRQAIEAALADPDPTNPIAKAVAARIIEFTKNLEEHTHRIGKWPTELLLHHPETVFDEIVIRLTVQNIADELEQPIEIVWVPSQYEA